MWGSEKGKDLNCKVFWDGMEERKLLMSSHRSLCMCVCPAFLYVDVNEPGEFLCPVSELNLCILCIEMYLVCSFKHFTSAVENRKWILISQIFDSLDFCGFKLYKSFDQTFQLILDFPQKENPLFCLEMSFMLSCFSPQNLNWTFTISW